MKAIAKKKPPVKLAAAKAGARPALAKLGMKKTIVRDRGALSTTTGRGDSERANPALRPKVQVMVATKELVRTPSKRKPSPGSSVSQPLPEALTSFRGWTSDPSDAEYEQVQKARKLFSQDYS